MRINTGALGIPRVTLTLGAVAALTVIAACTDNGGKAITAPQAPRTATISSGGYLNAKHVDLCVDASSPAGNYTFVNSNENVNIALTGNGFFFGGVWYDNGDGGDGTTVFNATSGTPYIVAAGSCITVLDRTSGDLDFMSGTDDKDSWAGVTITYNSNPMGAVYDHTDCLNDLGVLIPQQASPPATWPAPGYPCGNSNNPTRAFANFEHGTTVTFVFTTPPVLPCPGGSFTSSVDGSGNLNIKFDQFPAPNDNSYGVNAVGWPNGHTFGNLTGSDKAGFQLRDAGGVVRLSFNIDYLSAKTGTPSGYASLGPFGGDGGVLVGSLTPSDLSWDTSLSRNLNNTGFCVALNCSGGGTNLLVNSPPTINNTSYTLVGGSPYGAWDFHDTYFVTISAAKLASIGFNPATWSVEPNLTVLHNSPAKPCPVVGGQCQISVAKYEVKDKEVRITLANGASVDAFLTNLAVTWPQGTNGNLVQVKLDGDVIYNAGAIGGGTADLGVPPLVADQNKRKINHKSSDVLKLVFQNNAATNLALYTGTAKFGGDCEKTILPP